jgi:methylated-DNA-protein-cysteine methyltransferase related protein
VFSQVGSSRYQVRVFTHLDLPIMNDPQRRRSPDRSTAERELLHHRILATIDSIPRGAVATYGDVAREAGLPRRARLVGRVLSGLPARSPIPWHRVVNAAGRLSARPGGTAQQQRRLEREGLAFTAGGRLDLARHRWHPDVDGGAEKLSSTPQSRLKKRRGALPKGGNLPNGPHPGRSETRRRRRKR